MASIRPKFWKQPLFVITLALSLVILLVIVSTANRTAFVSIAIDGKSMEKMTLGVASGNLFLKLAEPGSSASAPSKTGADWAIVRGPAFQREPLLIVLPLWIFLFLLCLLLLGLVRSKGSRA